MKTVLILLVAAMVVYTAFVYILFNRHLAATHVLIKAAKPFERKIVDSTSRILVIGDSTEVGVGATTEAESIPGRIGHDYPNAYIENHAVSGITANEALADLQKVPDATFDLVLIQAGANDVTGRTPFDILRSDVRELLLEGKKKGTHVVYMTSGNIGFAPIFPFPLSWYFSHRSDAARNIFIDEAHKAGVAYVDLYKPKKDDPFSKYPKKYYASDAFHPSSEGYDIWYQELKPVLDGLLSSK